MVIGELKYRKKNIVVRKLNTKIIAMINAQVKLKHIHIILMAKYAKVLIALIYIIMSKVNA